MYESNTNKFDDEATEDQLKNAAEAKRRKRPEPKSGRSVIELKKILDERTEKEQEKSEPNTQ